MSNILRYISNNYHAFFMKSRGMYSADYEALVKSICNMISDLLQMSQLEINEIPNLMFINTAERKSKYIVTDDEHYILLDLCQILEYAWGSQVAICIDGDILNVVSTGDGYNEGNYDIDSSLFLFESNQNILKAKICNCYNLADLCFSEGYVDAAVKNLYSIISMRESIHSNSLADMILSKQLLYEAKIIGGFIYLHELTHYYIEQNKKNMNKDIKFEKLINLIRLNYESGRLSKEWKKYACEYNSYNNIVNNQISNLFSELKVNDRYPGLFEQLRDNVLSWKNLSFDLSDWDLYSEELVSDIIALNTIISNEKDYYIISYVVRALLIQETFSLQDNILKYITGKQKEIHPFNIKRVQLIFAALLVDYQEYEKQQGWNSIINHLGYNREEFDDLIIDLCNSVEVIHESFYLIAIQDFCKLLLSEDILHKNINCAYFLDKYSKKFVFTDDYSGKKNADKIHFKNIDALLFQKELTEEYEKFIEYVFK